MTSSISRGGSDVLRTSSRITVAASSVGGRSRKTPPKPPTAVLSGSQITASRTAGEPATDRMLSRVASGLTPPGRVSIDEEEFGESHDESSGAPTAHVKLRALVTPHRVKGVFSVDVSGGASL